MDERRLAGLLRRVRSGALPLEAALQALRDLPFEDLGHARVDHHRSLRCGHVEVIFGLGKTPGQVVDIARSLRRRKSLVLATRVTEDACSAVREAFPDVAVDELARAFTIGRLPRGSGLVAVVSAGTADGSVAAEAVLTARCLGARVDSISDVGVAGIHRLLAVRPRLQAARALVVVAGMEGALPSAVSGLVAVPVIAVPTSVGYGVAFGGVTALLAMLNSCASGVSVVNIDNGFGGGFQAALINRR